MAATPTTRRQRELDALALELIAAGDVAPGEARAEAEDQLAELMAYADGWDDQASAASLDLEILDLAHTLIHAEGLTVDEAIEQAERQINTLLYSAYCYDQAAAAQGNPDAIPGACPF